MKRRVNSALVALTLIRLGQELGTASPATQAVHDVLELIAALVGAFPR